MLNILNPLQRSKTYTEKKHEKYLKRFTPLYRPNSRNLTVVGEVKDTSIEKV